ncbi:MAG TPA: S41 family peptidase [Chloroflexi bacterium]|nr:S41 family peptidase [Chloroflexota bacterium]
MTKRNVLLTLMLIFICGCLSYGAGFSVYLLQERAQINHAFDVFWEAWDRVEDYFYGDLPTRQERTYGAIRGALALLGDPYTTFVEPQPRELERDRMRGYFGGIGVAIQKDDDGQVLLSPYPDSPAERAGVLEGDVLLAVDDHMVTDTTSLDTVKAWIRGEVGTMLRITISRPPTPPFDLSIEREEIQTPSVVWRPLEQDPSIAYIQIARFTERTGDEVIAALEELLRENHCKAVLLDLRDNSGGLIPTAVTTVSQFLGEGDVMIESSRKGPERVVLVESGGQAITLPLAVLVNGGTASAAEIVAGALQAHQRAPLIGETTFGKGSVQLIYDLSDGSSLHITSAIWLTPDRRPLEGQGLTPDILVSRRNGAQNETEDAQMERAITYLQTEMP